ncbi:carboxypeptidase regulatory-like domain-containing protein, partial [bacterium]
MTVTLTGPVNKSAVSSGSGTFSFPEIPAGNYVISVQGWNYGMTKQNFAAPSGKSVKVVLKGSCPYLYVWDGEKYRQENDIYSVARLTHWDVLPPETRMLASREGLTVHPISLSDVSAQLRRERSYRDYYAITKPLRPDVNGQYRLQIREQASEYSWTDLTNLVAVDHAPGRQVAVTRQGDIFLYGELQPARSFKDLNGQAFASLPATGLPLYNGEGLVFDLPPDAFMSGVMMVNWQGFQDGVGEGHTASQGLPRLRMERLDVEGNWLLVDYGYPRDEIQKTHFLLTEEKDKSMTSRVRLVAESCVAEKYHRIDGIFWGRRAEAAPRVHRLPLLSARTSLGEDVTASLSSSDGLSVLLGPEESMELRFDGAPLPTGEERSFIFVSEGVYMPMPYLNV